MILFGHANPLRHGHQANRFRAARWVKYHPPAMVSENTPAFEQGPTPLYAQLASILRSNINGGEWPPGFEIPTIDDLRTQYGLSRITVRQAIQMLVMEGLLSSQSGRRTTVTYDAAQADAGPVLVSIASLETEIASYSIQMLSRTEVKDLPVNGRIVGTSKGPYVHIRKVDCDNGSPYGLSNVYVSKEVYKRFPKGAETRSRLVRLVRQYAKPPLASGQELVSVAAADFEAAGLLNYPMSAPVARVQRILRDQGNRIVYFGSVVYRGDRFRLEYDLSGYAKHA